MRFRVLLVLGILVFIVSVGARAGAGLEEDGEKTLSPYFFVRSDDPDTDQFPLKSTSADVDISGVIADVKVTQVYKNEGKRPIEAVYVFPASTRAAVYGMKMTIGERVINSEIKKREEARQVYEDAKQQGRTASLLEQQRPNVFQMNVANIMPGDLIKVELKYTEMLVPEDKFYEFVYPTVVGPRYSNQPEESAPVSDRWTNNPYLHQGEQAPYEFDINVHLASGLPVQKITCNSHKVNVAYHGASAADIKLEKSEKNGGNRDYVLSYQLAGKQIDSGLLLYEGEKEKFFLLMLQPPDRVKASQIPGREYVFIVDVSGSMHGFPLEISKKLLKDLIGSLRPTDMFNVLLFAGSSAAMSEQSLPATSNNITKAISVIDKQQGGGGTELLPALKHAMLLPKAEGFSRTFIIATDGYVSVEAEAFDLIRNNLDKANLFSFGIGSSVNRHLIEGMARAGMGEPFIITKQSEAPSKAEAFRKMIESPVLTQIKVDFDGFGAYDIEPLSIPDVLADRPVILFGKWRGNAKGKITLKGISGEQAFTDAIDVSKIKPSQNNAALKYLWARYRIAVLSDYIKLQPQNDRIKEVTELGLKYNLLTAYTSFVAVDSEIRNKSGEATTIKQPLPLPEGVSDYAVGAAKCLAAPAMEMARTKAAGKQNGISEKIEDKKNQEDINPIKTDDITVTKGLSGKETREVVEKHLSEIQNCLRQVGFNGKITLKIIVKPDGSVKSVKVVSGKLTENEKQCIAQTVEKWKFSAAITGGEITVNFKSGK